MIEALWQPTPDFVAQTRLVEFTTWLEPRAGRRFETYDELWRWSVESLDAFWMAIWDFFDVRGHPAEQALASAAMPFASWFPGARVNYADQLLANERGDEVAVVALTEGGARRELTWNELRRQAAAFSRWLLDAGVEEGDYVVSYMPNIPETIVAFLGAASIGAVWSSCAPEFGVPGVVDRFGQTSPKVLLVADGYRFKGKTIDKVAAIDELLTRLPSVEHVVRVPYPGPAGAGGVGTPDDCTLWQEIVERDAEWSPRLMAFDHPLWVLYSSGTTGLPKPIVHSHGGILLEHLKSHGLQLDLGPQDVFFWFTSTGWVMWNLLTAGLLMGSTLVLFDGDPSYPDLDVLWQMADDLGVTVFGSSASYYDSARKAGLTPGRTHDLSSVRCVGSTGSPLSPEAFHWIYEAVSPDVWVMSFSGGTDIATAFVGGCPTLPVREGQLQCRWLGVDAAAYGEDGAPTDGIGELVVRQPMPSMPIRLLNDPEGERYRESYFSVFPGVWRHGDWIEFTDEGGAVIHGRSDATINRRGVRMGTAELYGVLDAMPEIADSLVVDFEGLGGASHMVGFLVVADTTRLDGQTLEDDLVQKVRTRLRTDLSPRHVPDAFFEVSAIPRTLNGKKLEVPVKRILLGSAAETVVSLDAVANPEALKVFGELRPAIRRSAGLDPS